MTAECDHCGERLELEGPPAEETLEVVCPSCGETIAVAPSVEPSERALTRPIPKRFRR